jgi:uncharacterized membrane protein
MRTLSRILLRGLVAVLPIGLTVYLVYWLGVTLESILGELLRLVLPENLYWPGLGLLAGIALLLVAGLLVNAYVVRRILGFGERLLARIPLVKTIFGALKDFTRFFPAGNGGRDLKRVVTARFGHSRAIGFVTQDAVTPRLFGEDSPGLVAVYFPMSYQIGGYTLYVPRTAIEETDLSVEEAMRLVLIGGLSQEAAPQATRAIGE